jgi:hypothetical protein
MTLQAQAVRLEKCFKVLLSASLPGEVVAARDAMLTIINGEKCDLHDLAKVLADGLKPPRAGWQPPEPEDSPRVIATWCLHQFDKMGALPRDEREYGFVKDIARRWGPATEKQVSWLAAIYNRMIKNAQR